MGAKCESICAGVARTPREFRDSLPDDIDEYHPDRLNKKLPKLSFEGSISNVKIINSPQNVYFGVKIKIEDIIEIDLPKRKIQPITEIKRQSGQQVLFAQNQLKWLSQEKLAFMMDEFELRTHFLNVYIYDQDKQIYSNIRVNLYSIVTGPYRYDFYVNLKNHSSRLLFEIDISQKVEAKLQPLQVKIELQKGYFAEEFNFSMRQLAHGQVISTSKVSNSQKTLPETSSQWSFDQQQSPILRRFDSPVLKQFKGKHLVIPNDPRRMLNWTADAHSIDLSTSKLIQSQQLTQPLRKKLPHLKIHILSNQIIKSNIHFNLWINKTKDLSDLPLKNIEKDSIIFGSIHFNLSKFFDQECKEIDAKHFGGYGEVKTNGPNYKLEMRKFSKQEKLISKEGQVLAKCWLKFRFTNPKFFKQLSYCVKTEDGVINMTLAFTNYSGKIECLKNPAINNILNHSIRIQSLAKQLSIMQVTIGTNRVQILRKEDDIYTHFDRINRQLVNSCGSSYVLSSHTLQLQLIEIQQALIQVLDQLHMFLMEKSWRFKQTCWQITFNIFKRGEFFLENLGFKEFGQKQYIHEQLIRKKKISLGLKFKCIIYKFLIMALDEQDKESNSGRIVWKQTFKAFGCFRVPIYRDKILRQINESSVESSQSNKDLHFEQINLSIPSNSFSEFEKSQNHLDWRHYFYQPLASFQQSHKLDKELESALQRSKWVRDLKQHSDQFFLFLGYTSRILGQLVKTLRTVKWKYFPGFTQNVRIFLIEMKKQHILSYSSTMIHTSIDLLVNDQLINILITIVLQKTDINDHDSLTRGMNLVWSYMSAVTQDGKRVLPQIFNYLYFYKMLKLVFDTDNCFALGKVLILVQAFFKCFNEQFKQNLAMYLMGKVFFKLFFHWSYAIRMVFHVIFISKIHYHLIKRIDDYQTTHLPKTKKSFLVIIFYQILYQVYHELSERYSNIMRLIYTAEILKKSQENEQLYNHCFKELHIKMKKKLSIKKYGVQPQRVEKQKNIDQFLHTKSPFSISNLMKFKVNIQGLQKDSFYYFIKDSPDGVKQKILRVRSYDDSKQGQQAIVSHGESFTLQDVGFQKCLKKFDTDIEYESQQGLHEVDQRISKQGLASMRSDRFIFTGSSQQQIKGEKVHSMVLNPPLSTIKRQKSVTYTYFGTEDSKFLIIISILDNLEEMTITQIRQILVSMTEFKTIKQNVDRFVFQYGRVPEFDFNVQLDRDECQAGLFKFKN